MSADCIWTVLTVGPECTAQHSTAQHSTAQHSTAQHSTAQHSAAQSLLQDKCSSYKGHSLFSA